MNRLDERLDDDRLAAVLAEIGADLVTTATVAVPARIRTRPPMLAWAVAAAVVVLVTASLAVSPVRRAVAGWLGIGSTAIEIGPLPTVPVAAEPPATDPATAGPPGGAPPATLPSIAAGLEPVERAATEAALGRLLPDFAAVSLGDPAGYARPPEGGALVVWADSTTLWIHPVQIGAGPLYSKLVSAGAQVEAVEELGDAALAIVGEHVLATPSRTIAATTVVLWQSGEWEFRLEADRTVDELADLAREIAAA